MKLTKTRKNDDSGVSVLLEYIFLMTITAVLFSLFIIVLYSIFTNADQVIIGDELGIVSNDVAGRISGFSGGVYLNQYSDPAWNSNVPGSTQTIDLPGLVSNNQYQVYIDYDPTTKSGIVTASYKSSFTANKTAGFRSDISVVPVVLQSTNQKVNLYYDSPGNKIILEGA